MFLHIVENLRIEDLDASEHYLVDRAGRCYRRHAVEEAADSTGRVDVHRPVLVGALIGAQHQRYHRIHANVEVKERRQIDVDKRVGINYNKSAVLQKCFCFEQSPASVEQLWLSRIADLQSQQLAAAQTIFDLVAMVMQINNDLTNPVVAQQ